MTLIVVHYHFRPGGIRRVIELATRHLCRALGTERVVLATGEAADPEWERRFRELLEGEVRWFLEPAFHYLTEQRVQHAHIKAAVERGCERLLAGYGSGAGEAVVWVHNLSVGRNPLLAHVLAERCARRGIPMVSHHHDWWFEHRWQRWPEMRGAGVRTLRGAARMLFATGASVRHAAINGADAEVLHDHLGSRAAWLPNPAELAPSAPVRQVKAARRWLTQQIGAGDAVWLLPCRLLRRKNVGEALLLTRWLRPGGVLVTTGGVSSADEEVYGRRLSEAAEREGWPLRLSVLAGDERRRPSVLDLLSASEAVLLTSIIEGFGLPFLEAAAAGRPLIGRRLANIVPDLARFGFRFPQMYDEVLVPTSLCVWRAERARQAKAFGVWRRQLPVSCRRFAGGPAALEQADRRSAIPFSRLTLTAQLEVLRHPADESWEACRKLNPFLDRWRRRAAVGALQASSWPREATTRLAGAAYAARFLELLRRRPRGAVSDGEAMALQEAFMAQRLSSEHLFPLLWSADL